MRASKTTLCVHPKQRVTTLLILLCTIGLSLPGEGLPQGHPPQEVHRQSYVPIDAETFAVITQF
jgi:hypothetical protein